MLPLSLRVPAWAAGAKASLSAPPGDASSPIPPAWLPLEPGKITTIHCPSQAGVSLTLRLPMTVRTERGYQDSIRVLRGPLVFSLKIGEEFRNLKGKLPHADWEVFPTTPWNYGLALGEGEVTVQERPSAPSLRPGCRPGHGGSPGSACPDLGDPPELRRPAARRRGRDRRASGTGHADPLRKRTPACDRLPGSDGGRMSEPWNKEKAWEWYEALPWLCGFNYLPSTDVNSTEM